MPKTISYNSPVCKNKVWIYEQFSYLKGSACFKCAGSGVDQVKGFVQGLFK